MFSAVSGPVGLPKIRPAQRTKLGELKNAGVLTEAEFETQKARILA